MVKDNFSQTMQWGSTEIAGPRHCFREDLLYKVFKQKLRGGRVLDAGSGSGSMFIRLLNEGYLAEGIEMSLEFVNLVNKKAVDLGLSDGTVIKAGTITELPWTDDYFDGLIAGEVLEHVEDDKRAVGEFRRVLKKNGVCVISVPANPKLWDESDEWAGHKRRYLKEDLINLFQRGGFSVEDVFYWGFPLVRLWNRFVFLGWLSGRKDSGEKFTFNEPNSLKKLLIRIISTAFKFDNLFNRFPFGTGIILVARK